VATLTLPIHSYRLRSAQSSTARLVNCFAEALPADAKGQVLLTRAPGLASWAEIGNGPIEGMHADHGLLYVVSGGDLYSVTSAASATLRGVVGISTEIDMDSNDSAVVVVSPPLAYYWNGSTFAQITDTDFTTRGAGDVEFLDGYMLFREPGSARFFASDLNSVTAYDALQFATAEGASDELVGLKVDHRQVFLAGEKSCEIWENTGASGFPFERSINGFLELGCLNGKSIAKLDNSILWVANDYTVRRLDGLTPARISTHAIEQWLKDSVTIASLRGSTWTQDGHLFYMLRATEGCFVYDVTTQLWHERQSYGSSTWNWDNPVMFAGMVLVGSTTSNVVAKLDPAVYTELGSTLRTEWSYQPVYADAARAYHERLEMLVERGVGNTSDPGSDPEIMLDASDDGGRTWLSLPNRTIGKIGKYAQRCSWHALGSSDARVYRAAVSDPVKVTVTDTQLQVRGGRL
jgi:hypothetical protein